MGWGLIYYYVFIFYFSLFANDSLDECASSILLTPPPPPLHLNDIHGSKHDQNELRRDVWELGCSLLLSFTINSQELPTKKKLS